MKQLFVILFLLIFSLKSTAEKPEFSSKVEKELIKYFNTDIISTHEIKELSNESDLFFKAYSRDKELGLVVLTSAKGRFDYFDYMIVYNQKLEIEFIKILVYRSDYGSEITAKRWLSQFYSKKLNDFKYASDIQAISGATFSASSLTNNINRINKILRDYERD